MLSLPDVTIVVIDCVAHELTELALRDTLARIDPGDVIVFSDKKILGFDNILCQHNSVNEAFETLWYRVPSQLKTSHYLHIEWDGWVIDETLWDSRWLERDYVGAPWPWHNETYRVGNGGFSLRSSILARFLARNRTVLPLLAPEDDTLCRTYRPQLEREGFEWATLQEAERFSLEHGPFRHTFGFHDYRNWPRLLDLTTLEARLRAAPDYVKTKHEWQEMEVAVEGALDGFGRREHITTHHYA